MTKKIISEQAKNLHQALVSEGVEVHLEHWDGHKHDLLYIDVFETLDPSSDLDDGLHPNATGYQKMYEVIKSKFDWI